MTGPGLHEGGLTPDDRRLLERLLAELGPRLLAYVRQLAPHAQDAEDIVAETFCRAADNMAAVRATDRPDLYFLTTARNLCRDRIRRLQTRIAHAELIRPALAVAGDPRAAEPAAAMQHEEDLRALRAAVAELPESLREVVVLRLATGLRFEDIAAVLALPLGTALSRMHAAVGHLRVKLGATHERV